MRRKEDEVKIKIISDGTPEGTRVVNAGTGEPIDRIAEVRWRATAWDCETWLRFVDVPVELVGEMKEEEEGGDDQRSIR